MVESVCRTCSLSALCIGAGGSLEELIARMVTEYIDKFERSGPSPVTEYEENAIRGVAATQAAKRMKKLLESRLPTTCPILRRHHANSEGKPVVFIDTPAELEDDAYE